MNLAIIRLLAAVILFSIGTLAPVLAVVVTGCGLVEVEAETRHKTREMSGVEGSSAVDARACES